MDIGDKIPAVILAGGRASRMGGQDKALVPLAGATLISHVVGQIEPQVSKLAINAPHKRSGYPDFPVLPDTVGDQPGPLAGILTALLWAHSQNASHVLTVAVDTPFLPDTLVDDLRAKRGPIVMAETEGGAEPVTALWSVALIQPLKAALAKGTRKVIGFAEAQGVEFVRFPNEAFFNVNSPEDLAQAELRLRRPA